MWTHLLRRGGLDEDWALWHGGNLAECPEPLERFAVNERRYCRRTAAGCTSVYFSPLGKNYSAVCGMVEAYQYGSMDAFLTSLTSIDSLHLDGILITHGSSWQHIWSYVVGDVASPTSSRSAHGFNNPHIILYNTHHGNCCISTTLNVHPKVAQRQ